MHTVREKKKKGRKVGWRFDYSSRNRRDSRVAADATSPGKVSPVSNRLREAEKYFLLSVLKTAEELETLVADTKPRT